MEAGSQLHEYLYYIYIYICYRPINRNKWQFSNIGLISSPTMAQYKGLCAEADERIFILHFIYCLQASCHGKIKHL